MEILILHMLQLQIEIIYIQLDIWILKLETHILKHMRYRKVNCHLKSLIRNYCKYKI